MSEPLDLHLIRERDALAREWAWRNSPEGDRRALLAEVDRLRDEVTDRANVEADLRAQLAEMQARLPDEDPKPFHSLIARPGPYRCTGCDWHGRWDLMHNAAKKAWSDAHTVAEPP